MAQVNEVLKEIGAENVHQILVFNKVDLIEGLSPRIDRDKNGRVSRVWLSAASGAGVELLLSVLEEEFRSDKVHEWVRVPASNGRLRAKLFALGKVLKECVEDSGDLLFEVEMPRKELENLQKTEGIRLSPENINCCG